MLLDCIILFFGVMLESFVFFFGIVGVKKLEGKKKVELEVRRWLESNENVVYWGNEVVGNEREMMRVGGLFNVFVLNAVELEERGLMWLVYLLCVLSRLECIKYRVNWFYVIVCCYFFGKLWLMYVCKCVFSEGLLFWGRVILFNFFLFVV